MSYSDDAIEVLVLRENCKRREYEVKIDNIGKREREADRLEEDFYYAESSNRELAARFEGMNACDQKAAFIVEDIHEIINNTYNNLACVKEEIASEKRALEKARENDEAQFRQELSYLSKQNEGGVTCE